jgi:hypothetical protein
VFYSQATEARPYARTVPAWQGSSESAWFRWGGVALVVLGGASAMAAQPLLALTFVVAGGALLLLERVEVRVDDRGLQAANRWGWPRVRFPLDEIDGATAIEVQPRKWGGWGYRGSVSLFHRAAWILHGGPGIRLDLIGSRVFVVAVDDAETGAAVLQSQLTPPG